MGEAGWFCEKLRLPRFLFPVGGAKLLEEREKQSARLLSVCLPQRPGEPACELAVSVPKQFFFTVLASLRDDSPALRYL